MLSGRRFDRKPMFLSNDPTNVSVAEVTITYCRPCRYQPKAIQDADAILKEFGEELSDVRLVPGADGVYDVEVDGTLIFSLDQAMRFPETPELIRKIRAKIGPTNSGQRKA